VTPTHLTQKQQKPHSPPAEADGVRGLWHSQPCTHKPPVAGLLPALVLAFLIGSLQEQYAVQSVSSLSMPHCSLQDLRQNCDLPW